jgi:hypothetical protein
MTIRLKNRSKKPVFGSPLAPQRTPERIRRKFAGFSPHFFFL